MTEENIKLMRHVLEFMDDKITAEQLCRELRLRVIEQLRHELRLHAVEQLLESERRMK